MKTKQRLLLCIGLFIFSLAQIVLHFYNLNDFPRGIISGIGIGLIFLSLFNSKHFSPQ